MAQQWCDLLFAHWPIPAAAMRAFVPPALKLDTYDGQAWIGVVPFHMRNVRPRALPAVPWLSHFAELNVRTYVTAADGSRPGVWFFSLDAANPVAVMLARRFFMLPYFNAAMDVRTVGDAVYYTSRRTHTGAAPAHFMARYRPPGPVYRSARDAGAVAHGTMRAPTTPSTGAAAVIPARLTMSRGRCNRLRPKSNQRHCRRQAGSAGQSAAAFPSPGGWTYIWPIKRVTTG
ncbi:MAG: DUF2071 domain-containing protein [Caldilineaceae bacterium]